MLGFYCEIMEKLNFMVKKYENAMNILLRQVYTKF